MIEQLTHYLSLALELVGLFALIATMTPNKTDDELASKLWQVINFLGANVGKAKNDPRL